MNVLMILISVLLAGLTAAVIYLMFAPTQKKEKNIKTYEEELRKMQIALADAGAEGMYISHDVLHFEYAEQEFDFQYEYGLTHYPLRARLLFSLRETDLFETLSETGRALIANLVGYEFPTLAVCSEYEEEDNKGQARCLFFSYWFSYSDVNQALETMGEGIATLAGAVNLTVDLLQDKEFVDAFSIENEAEDDAALEALQERMEGESKPLGYSMPSKEEN